MKILSVGIDLFLADRWTDGRKDKNDEANSSFSQFCDCANTRIL